jgi:hypothetical protein
MTKTEFKEIIKTKGALGEGYIIEHLFDLIQEHDISYIQYKTDANKLMTEDWSSIQGRIKFTIKELSKVLDTKVSFFKFEVFNGTINKFYTITLIVHGIEYEKLSDVEIKKEGELDG